MKGLLTSDTFSVSQPRSTTPLGFQRQEGIEVLVSIDQLPPGTPLSELDMSHSRQTPEPAKSLLEYCCSRITKKRKPLTLLFQRVSMHILCTIELR